MPVTIICHSENFEEKVTDCVVMDFKIMQSISAGVWSCSNCCKALKVAWQCQKLGGHWHLHEIHPTCIICVMSHE